MPLYEFECAGCGQSSEMLVRSTDWKGVACPHCGSKKLAKAFSTFASKVAAGTVAASPAPQACARPGGCGCVGAHRH